MIRSCTSRTLNNFPPDRVSGCAVDGKVRVESGDNMPRRTALPCVFSVFPALRMKIQTPGHRLPVLCALACFSHTTIPVLANPICTPTRMHTCTTPTLKCGVTQHSTWKDQLALGHRWLTSVRKVAVPFPKLCLFRTSDT